MLLSWDVSIDEIIQAIRNNRKAKNQRRRTVNNTKYEAWEKAFEKASRSFKQKMNRSVKQLQEPPKSPIQRADITLSAPRRRSSGSISENRIFDDSKDLLDPTTRVCKVVFDFDAVVMPKSKDSFDHLDDNTNASGNTFPSIQQNDGAIEMVQEVDNHHVSSSLSSSTSGAESDTDFTLISVLSDTTHGDDEVLADTEHAYRTFSTKTSDHDSETASEPDSKAGKSSAASSARVSPDSTVFWQMPSDPATPGRATSI